MLTNALSPGVRPPLGPDAAFPIAFAANVRQPNFPLWKRSFASRRAQRAHRLPHSHVPVSPRTFREFLMRARFIIVSAAALVLAATSPARSHHPSGTGTSSTGGPIVTIPGTTLQQGASAAYFVFEHFSFDELSNAALEAAAERDEHAHSLATLDAPALGYAYGLTDRLMVSVQLPYVVRTGIREANSGRLLTPKASALWVMSHWVHCTLRKVPMQQRPRLNFPART